MTMPSVHEEQRFAAMPVPLKSISVKSLGTIQEFAEKAYESISTKRTESRERQCEGQVQAKIVNIGALKVISGKTTPMDAELEVNHNITVDLCYEGEIKYKNEKSKIGARKGELFAIPNEGGTHSVSYYSGIALELNIQQLERTMRVLNKDAKTSLLKQAWSTSKNISSTTQRIGEGVFALFRYIDTLLSESVNFPGAMGLDDQIYRVIALEYLRGDEKSMERIRQRRFDSNITKRDAFNHLIDYIKANGDKGITLTDLEEQSRYSRRHLQNLFKEKFDCTPMQFVRRQNLSVAMERLQTADWDETVTSIARDIGYRYTPNFTTDFNQEFGVNPSVVLRSSRATGNRI